MSLLNNSFLNIYSLLILLTIYYMTTKWNDKELFNNKLFILIIQITIFLLFVDVFSRFDGNGSQIYVLLNHTGNFLIFLLNPLLVSMWVLYAHYNIYNNEKKTKELIPSLLVINILNMVMVFLTQFYGWFYYIDSNNVYHRGPLFLFSVAITVTLMLVSFIMTVTNYKNIEKRYFRPLLFFTIPPFIGIILQTYFYGISLVLNCVVFSLLIVFLTIQHHTMSTDYLTGLYNRKKIERYLDKKIKSCTPLKTFSGIMLDMNNFKSINDTFGHDKGDEALEISGNLMKECIRDTDILARFGGDEFFIILNISDEDILRETVNRIKLKFDEFNEAKRKPYVIEFSMGYGVYGYYSKMNGKEFQKHLDVLMYKDKDNNNKLDTIER